MCLLGGMVKTVQCCSEKKMCSVGQTLRKDEMYADKPACVRDGAVRK